MNSTAYLIEVMTQQFDLQPLLNSIDRGDQSVLDEASVKSDDVGFIPITSAAPNSPFATL